VCGRIVYAADAQNMRGRHRAEEPWEGGVGRLFASKFWGSRSESRDETGDGVLGVYLVGIAVLFMNTPTRCRGGRDGRAGGLPCWLDPGSRVL
jgi:hypothetical protein